MHGMNERLALAWFEIAWQVKLQYFVYNKTIYCICQNTKLTITYWRGF